MAESSQRQSEASFSVVEELLNNIERLKQAYLRLKTENQELFQQKQQLLAELDQKEKYIQDLKKQIENLKLSNALIFSGQNIDTENLQEIKQSAKIKLSQIIREIDTAIKLLSTYELQ